MTLDSVCKKAEGSYPIAVFDNQELNIVDFALGCFLVSKQNLLRYDRDAGANVASYRQTHSLLILCSLLISRRGRAALIVNTIQSPP